MKRLRLFLVSVWRWYRHHSLYVILDPRDNSVTLSRTLFDHMDPLSHDQAKVFVFTLAAATIPDAPAATIPEASAEGKTPALKTYAFTLNPTLSQPTQLCDIQYNSKLRSIGFQTLCPTVNRILYDYAIPARRSVKLSVDIATIPDASASGKGMTIYKILHPQR